MTDGIWETYDETIALVVDITYIMHGWTEAGIDLKYPEEPYCFALHYKEDDTCNITLL